MKTSQKIAMGFAVASMVVLTGCMTPEPHEAEKKAADTQTDAMLKYSAEGKWGQPIPRLEGEALNQYLHDSYTPEQKTAIKKRVADAYKQGRALLIKKWIEHENKRIADEVEKLMVAAELDASTNGMALAHAKVEQAREILWQSCVVAKEGDKLLDEVNGPVRNASLELLDTKVNPRHWPMIEREMRLMADQYAIEGRFDDGVVALNAYPYIRTYTKLLDDRLNAVTAELVRLHVPALALKPISEKARQAMMLAANLRDDADVVSNEEKDNTLEQGNSPNLKQYQDLLKEYHDALLMYGCTAENAKKITEYFAKNVNELIADLRKDPKYGKEFLKHIRRLGASAINKRINAVRKELLGELDARKAERAKMLAPIEDLLAKGDLRGAQEYAIKALVTMDKGSAEFKFLRPMLINYITTKVNPELWEKIQKEILEKVDAFVKDDKASEGIAWLEKFPYIRTYAEEIDKSYADVKAEAVSLGVPEEVAAAIIDEIATETAKLDYLANFDDYYTDIIVTPAKPLVAKDLIGFEKKLAAARKALVENDCTPANADMVVTKLREKFNPEFGKIGQEVRTNVLVLGACALNKRLKALKEGSVATILARCATAKVEAGDFPAARALIRDVRLTGDDEFDAVVYAYRVGILNSIVNPLQLVDELKKIEAKGKAFVDAGDYRGFQEWVKSYPGVHDEYADIAAAIETIRKAAVGIKIEEQDAADYAASLSELLRVKLEQRDGKYAGPEAQVDLTEVVQGVDTLAKAVLAQYFDRDFVETLIEKLPKDIVKLLRRNQPESITTWELNERLRLRVKDILAVFKDIEKLIARQEYLELLAKMDSEFNYDSQVAMAEDAIAKQLGINCPDAYLKANAVLGDYARAMRLLKMKATLTADQLVSVALGAVYLDQPAVFDHARDLGADVNGVSERDPLKRTALLFAIQLGRTAFVHRLVAAGAKVDAADAAGDTTVHYAARRGNLAVLNAMLQKNDANVKNAKGRTALFFAVSANQEPVVAALIAAKIDVSIKDADGLTAMDVACISGSRDVLDALADAGAVYGPAQLALAADNDRLAVAEWLVLHGVDVNAEPVVAAVLCGSDTKNYLVHEGLVPQNPCTCRICKRKSVKQEVDVK